MTSITRQVASSVHALHMGRDMPARCERGAGSVCGAAGVDAGSRLRVRGEGNVGRKGGEPGDLYVFISVKPHPAGLRREGTTIHSEVEISFVDAILGTTAKVSPLSARTILLLVLLYAATLLLAWEFTCASCQ